MGTTGGRRRLSPQELAGLEQERQHRHQERLAALPNNQREQIAKITGSLEENLVEYLHTPRAEQDVLESVNTLTSNLGNALMYAGDASGSKGRGSDLQASLLGASFVFNVARESDPIVSPTELPLMRRFLDIVSRRVTRWVELHERHE